MSGAQFITGVLLCFLLINTGVSKSSSSSFPTKNKSFRVDFIRRDSPVSPFYNSSQTQYDRIRSAFLRSSMAVNERLQSSSSSSSSTGVRSRVYPNNVEFLLDVSIGSPPFRVLAIADSGSDLFWTNCKPCTNCFKQDKPMFDPSSSSTYRSLSCKTHCMDYVGDFQCDSKNKCRYEYRYGDKSFAVGLLSTETLTLSTSSGDPVSFPNTTFGCSHQSGGTFKSTDTGIVGLGGGPLSIISQLGPSIDNKFSYCLVPYVDVNSSSTFTFGPSENITGLDVASTPLIPTTDDTFYTFFVASIEVGNTSVQVAEDPDVISPNFLIDSGTTATLLPTKILNDLINAISNIVTLEPSTDNGGGFPLCYKLPSGSKHGDIGLPDITLSMGNNVTVTLPPTNTFAQISDDTTCLIMVDSGDVSSFSILGNIAQQNFLVEYDLGKKLLSFAPMDCTKY